MRLTFCSCLVVSWLVGVTITNSFVFHHLSTPFVRPNLGVRQSTPPENTEVQPREYLFPSKSDFSEYFKKVNSASTLSLDKFLQYEDVKMMLDLDIVNATFFESTWNKIGKCEPSTSLPEKECYDVLCQAMNYLQDYMTNENIEEGDRIFQNSAVNGKLPFSKFIEWKPVKSGLDIGITSIEQLSGIWKEVCGENESATKEQYFEVCDRITQFFNGSGEGEDEEDADDDDGDNEEDKNDDIANKKSKPVDNASPKKGENNGHQSDKIDENGKVNEGTDEDTEDDEVDEVDGDESDESNDQEDGDKFLRSIPPEEIWTMNNPIEIFDDESIALLKDFYDKHATEQGISFQSVVNWAELKEIFQEKYGDDTVIQTLWTEAVNALRPPEKFGKLKSIFAVKLNFDEFSRFFLRFEQILVEMNSILEGQENFSPEQVKQFFRERFDSMCDGNEALSFQSLLHWSDLRELVDKEIVSLETLVDIWKSLPKITLAKEIKFEPTLFRDLHLKDFGFDERRGEVEGINFDTFIELNRQINEQIPLDEDDDDQTTSTKN